MAVTGLFFVAFVILHAYGNLKVFLGEKDYNDYALALRTFLMPILPYEGLLWILRAVLLVCILVHVVAAFYLWHRSAKARGSRYMVKKSLATAYAARTVRWGGVILLFFILFHLGHFTLKWAKIGNPAAYGSHQVTLDAAGAVVPEGADSAVITVTEGYPYAMMYTTFSNWWMVLIYGIAVAALCLHIAHGVWSALQSVGWLRRNTEVPVQIISGLVGLAVLVMFLLPPVCFLAGLMPAPAPVA